ncbi:MAG: tetrahydrofolate dehydrogenase/cyclohydrolase catalytic domain-containing protein, partial [Candidatus Micrarchaeota archaeon]
MVAKLIDGKKIADEILEEVASEVKKLKTKPKLALIRVGEDAASKIYLKKKEGACARVGIISENYVLPEGAGEDEVLALIEKLNRDQSCTGILVQLPLPKHINETRVVSSIAPEKDADGFHPANIGRLLEGDEARAPCTPSGIIALLERSGVKLEGKRAVVVGRSMIV